MLFTARGICLRTLRITSIFMSVLCIYIFKRPSSKSKSSDCSELDSEIILSECRIVGAHEGTRLELGVRLVTLQLYNSELQELQVLVC